MRGEEISCKSADLLKVGFNMTLQTASCWNLQFLWKHWIGGANLTTNRGLNRLNRKSARVWRSTTSLISSRNEGRQALCASKTQQRRLFFFYFFLFLCYCRSKEWKNNKMKQYFIHKLITFVFCVFDTFMHLCSFFVFLKSCVSSWSLFEAPLRREVAMVTGDRLAI